MAWKVRSITYPGQRLERGGNFNVLKSEVKTDGSWQKWDVTLASPSKATAWVGWAPDPWSLRVQTQQVFDLTTPQAMKSKAITPSISSAVIAAGG
jgi:iron complex outermembrane receptor protein